MNFKYKFGDKVKVTNLPIGTEGSARIGDDATVVDVDQEDPEGLTYRLKSEQWYCDWWFSEQDIESVLTTRERVLKEISEANTRLEELHKLLETFN